MSKIQQYYDETADFYQNVGANDRNRKIHQLLLRFGLKRTHRALEIGCGVGIQTDFLAKVANSVVAIDLSSKSIDLAKVRFSHHKNIQWLAIDVFEANFEETFDVIVLPDVLQYIPIEQQTQLFAKLKVWLSPKGFILLHFPTATFIAWSKLYDPSKLNIDDLEITDNQLVSCVFSSQLEIQALEKYALWQRGGDYQYVVLRHPIAPNDFDTRTLPLWKKIWKKVASFI